MIALIDIDHTLSNATWRDDMIGRSSWDEYHAEAIYDLPIPEMIALVQALYASSWDIFGNTSRPEKFHTMTMDWLVKYDVPMFGLLMRPNDCYLPAPESKVAVFKKHFADVIDYSHIVVFDDREDVCAAFKAICITTFQVSANSSPRTKDVPYVEDIKATF